MCSSDLQVSDKLNLVEERLRAEMPKSADAPETAPLQAGSGGRGAKGRAAGAPTPAFDRDALVKDDVGLAAGDKAEKNWAELPALSKRMRALSEAKSANKALADQQMAQQGRDRRRRQTTPRRRPSSDR